MVNNSRTKKRPQSVHANKLGNTKQNTQLEVFNDYIADLVKTKAKTSKQIKVNCAKMPSCGNIQTQKCQKNSKGLYLNGLSLKQWKNITDFTIVGQSNKKKKNFNVAINHYFNLKSMYKKINSIQNKPSLYSYGKDQYKPRKVQTSKQKQNSSTQENIDLNQVDPQYLQALYQLQYGDLNQEPVKKKKRVKSKNKSKKTTKKVKQIIEEIQPDPEPLKKSMKKTKLKPKRKAKSINKTIKGKMKIKTKPPKEKKELKQSVMQNFEEQQQQREEELIQHNQKFLEEEKQYSQSEKIESEPMQTNEVQEEKMQESISNNAEQIDIENLRKEIPILQDKTEQNLDSFKETIVNLIFKFEIFGDNEFVQFFDEVCQKNQNLSKEEIQDIFQEVKQFLYEQFQDEIENYDDDQGDDF